MLRAFPGVASVMALALLLGHERPARAQEDRDSRLGSIGEFVLYGAPLLFATTTIVVNGAAWGFETPSERQRAWFWAGIGSGALEIGVGAYLFSTGPEGTGENIVAGAPVVVGAIAIALAFAAPDAPRTGTWEPVSRRLLPVATPAFTGLTFSTPF